MTRQTQNTFPSWGDTGDSPPAGTDYTSGDNPKAQHYDYLWNELNVQFGNVTADFDRLDSDGDGVVDKADSGAAGFTFDGSFSLPAGSKIEDGSGNARFGITSVQTSVRDDTGAPRFITASGSSTEIRATSNEPFRLRDQQAGQTAIEYTTGSTVGELRLSGAGLNLATNDLTFDTGTTAYASGGGGIIFQTGTAGSRFRFRSANSGDTLLDVNEDGLVDVRSGRLFARAGIRVGAGRPIEDGAGTNRITFGSNATNIADESGDIRFSPRSASGMTMTATADSPIIISDDNGAFTAAQYKTSASAPGTFELTNADLEVPATDIRIGQTSSTDFTQLSIQRSDGTDGFEVDQFLNSTGDYVLQHKNRSTGSEQFKLTSQKFGRADIDIANTNVMKLFDSRVELTNTPLRLPTGQGIQDGSGQARINFNSSSTQLSGASAAEIFLRGNGTARHYVGSNQSFNIYDNAISADAVSYNSTGSSKGTFKLTNADLDLAGNDIKNAGSRRFLEKVTSGSATVQPSSDEVVLSNMNNEILLAVNAKNTTQGSNGVEVIYGNGSGELVLRNKDGGDSIDVSYTAYRVVA